MSIFKDEEEKKIAKILIGAAMLHALVSKHGVPTVKDVAVSLEIADEFIKQVDV